MPTLGAEFEGEPAENASFRASGQGRANGGIGIRISRTTCGGRRAGRSIGLPDCGAGWLSGRLDQRAERGGSIPARKSFRWGPEMTDWRCSLLCSRSSPWRARDWQPDSSSGRRTGLRTLETRPDWRKLTRDSEAKPAVTLAALYRAGLPTAPRPRRPLLD